MKIIGTFNQFINEKDEDENDDLTDFDVNIDMDFFGDWDDDFPNPEDDEDDENVDEAVVKKGRAPKLSGKDKKRREAKSKVMKKVLSDPKIANAKDKFFKILRIAAKKAAKEEKIPIQRIDLDKVTLRRESNKK